jgi:hypothetical protein
MRHLIDGCAPVQRLPRRQLRPHCGRRRKPEHTHQRKTQNEADKHSPKHLLNSDPD